MLVVVWRKSGRGIRDPAATASVCVVGVSKIGIQSKSLGP